MMREHKFRAWDLVLGKMFYFSLRDPMDIAKTHKNEQGIFVDRYVVTQYTGLKDKNGTEIYEGDIVDIGIPLDRTRKNFIGEISYCTEFACFRVDHPNIILISEYDGIEIIGNVYEHPHLLGD